METIQELLGRFFFMIVVAAIVYGILIKKALAKNAEIKKAAGAKVVGMILKWLK